MERTQRAVRGRSRRAPLRENERTSMGAPSERIQHMKDEIMDAAPVIAALLFCAWGWRFVALLVGRVMGWC